LVAVEVRNWIFREVKSDITVFDLLSQVPISSLAVRIAEKSKLIPQEWKEVEAGDAEPVTSE
jgi:hypothetical protein